MSSTANDAPAHVTCTVSDGVATIAIDDGKANALAHAVLAGIETALDQALEADAKVVVIEGRDGKFSAGFDLSVMTAGPTEARDMLGRGAELGLRLYEFPTPVVFAVTGHALPMPGILQCFPGYFQ
jgi:enoyl-CoA hydratase